MGSGLLRMRATGAGRRTQQGFSMLELTVAMGISASLALGGLGPWNGGHMELVAAQHELAEGLDQAFCLARARGRNITVGLGSGRGPDFIPIQLGRKVRWGKPSKVPLPPGMKDPVRADVSGEAHARITVTPRRTATASLWFLHDGEDVLCLRLSPRGRVQMLRWRTEVRRWARV